MTNSQHQLPRFLSTQLLRVLKRTHAGEGALRTAASSAGQLTGPVIEGASSYTLPTPSRSVGKPLMNAARSLLGSA